MKKVLLVEPEHQNKYPPLGLMKISSYHRLKGDKVVFYKGTSPQLREMKWDRVYISTLFTFYWNETVRTIKYYRQCVESPDNLIVGGVMATLMRKELKDEVGANIISGLLDKPGMIGNDNIIVDSLTPDYSILSSSNYEYPVGKNEYLGYATRGCKNRCSFCAVGKIEPKFIPYIPLKKQVAGIRKIYGEKKDLILLDNNVLASGDFKEIIYDIKELGFEKGAKLDNKQRYVDFNQGLDARRLHESKVSLLSEIAIHPMRIAFDFIGMRDLYIEKIRLAAKYGILNLSNYILYNFRDSPLDLYRRLKINVLLNEELGTKIYSFPMKYIPLDSRNRRYIGPKWKKKYIRAVQSILLATRGMVSPNRDFFEAAFGGNEKEFMEILLMPEEYIIFREKHRCNGASEWKKIHNRMTFSEKRELNSLIKNNIVTKDHFKLATSQRVKKALEHYLSL